MSEQIEELIAGYVLKTISPEEANSQDKTNIPLTEAISDEISQKAKHC
jgi:hypothetical protein